MLIPILPDASATVRGAVSTGTQTFAGAKTFSSAPTFSTMTQGSILFAGSGGLVSQNNAALFWGNATGSLGIGTALPTCQLHVAGTYTTANANKFGVTGTIASSNTGSIAGLQNQVTVVPTGASLSVAYGMINIATLNTSALTVPSVYGVFSRVDTASGFTGTITNADAYQASNPSLAGTNPLTNYNAFHASAATNGNGITTGTVTNTGLLVNPFTAAAASGGIINNYGVQSSVPTGSGAGTTSNYGVRITGAGGSGGLGTTNNWALYSDSTVSSYFAGNVQLGTTSASVNTDTADLYIFKRQSLNTFTDRLLSMDVEYDGASVQTNGGFRPVMLTCKYLATDTIDPFTQTYVGFSSSTTYGQQSPPIAAKGTMLGIVSSIQINNSSNYEDEHAAYFGFLRYDNNNNAFGNTTPGRAWLMDSTILGAVNQQQGSLGGWHIFLRNYYNGPSRDAVSGAYWAITGYNGGATQTAYHTAAPSYSLGVGFGVVGNSSGGSTRGYELGVQIGGSGSNWNQAFSHIGTGIDCQDCDTAALWVRNRYGGITALYVANGGSLYTVEPNVTASAAPSGGLTPNFTATLTATTVASASVTINGSGYTSIPAVTVDPPTPSGTTATITAKMGVNVAPAVAAGGSGYTVSDVLTATGGTFSVAAQFTVTSAPGGIVATVSLLTAGSYSVLPTNPVSVTGGTGTLATFTISNWKVVSLTVGGAGSGYTTRPTIAIDAPASGVDATGKTLLTGTSLASVRCNCPGKGYVSPPTISVARNSDDSTGTGATVVAPILTSGVVADAKVTVSGTLYSSAVPPVVTVSGGQGSGCTLTLVTSGGVITSATVAAGGTGYPISTTVYLSVATGVGGIVSVPTDANGTCSGTVIVLNGGTSGYVNGTNATTNWKTAAMTAVINTVGAITGFFVTDMGAGYSSPPTLSVAAPATSTATGYTTVLAGGVTAITVSASGNGYYSGAPAITFDNTGAGGTGASATAHVLYGQVYRVEITDDGDGAYVRTGDDGTGGTVLITVSAGAVATASVAAAGSGYPISTLIRLYVNSGDFKGVISLTTNGSGQLAGAVTVVNGGSGYAAGTFGVGNVPRVTFASPAAGTTGAGAATLGGYSIYIDPLAGAAVIDSIDGMAANNNRTTASHTVPAYYTSVQEGMPYRINAGLVITVQANALLRVKP